MGQNIFGYSWEDIQRAQQGGSLVKARISGEARKPLANESDYALLDQIGMDGLREKGYFGVIDRLENSFQLFQ